MKRFLKILVLLALTVLVLLAVMAFVVPAFAQDDCPGCPPEQPQPPCGVAFTTLAGPALCLAALKAVRK